MNQSLPDTIDPNNAKYVPLGQELDRNLGRADGVAVAKSLHAHFEQDLQDWFYDRILPCFSGIPLEKWSQNDSITAEYSCRNVISFFQSVRGAAAGVEGGFVPATRTEWYTGWLLRLNLGDSSAEEAKREWLPAFIQRNGKDQMAFFSAAMATFLPEVDGKFVILRTHVSSLELRVQATTMRAFGDGSHAQRLHAEAVLRDDRLAAVLDQYSTGGAVCYVLENDEGLLITQWSQYGTLLHVWSTAEYAREINAGQGGGAHSISTVSYRELDGLLQRMQSSGMRYVLLDRRVSGDVKVIPIGSLLAHVQQTINATDSSEIGKAMKQGFEG